MEGCKVPGYPRLRPSTLSPHPHKQPRCLPSSLRTTRPLALVVVAAARHAVAAVVQPARVSLVFSVALLVFVGCGCTSPPCSFPTFVALCGFFFFLSVVVWIGGPTPTGACAVLSRTRLASLIGAATAYCTAWTIVVRTRWGSWAWGWGGGSGGQWGWPFVHPLPMPAAVCTTPVVASPWSALRWQPLHANSARLLVPVPAQSTTRSPRCCSRPVRALTWCPRLTPCA